MKTVKDVVAAYPDGNELPFKNGQEVFIAQINTLAGVVEKRYYVKQYWCHSGHQSEYVTLGIIFDNKIDAENKCRELLGLPKRMIAGATSVNEQWYDYDKQESISLPPVGVECEFESTFFTHKQSNNGRCKVISYHKDKAWVEFGITEFVINLNVISFRPLDWNKNKYRDEFIKKSRISLKEWNTLEDIFIHQYNAGARFND
jgi:hypothetical protein